MGTGEQQILAMAFAHAYAKAFHGGILLVIEEPEAHLHPLAQSWLAGRLQSMCENDLQVVVTTHSAAFVDVLNLEGLALIKKVDKETRISQISISELIQQCEDTGVPAGRSTESNILPFYAANATREILEGFFAKLVVLVEGPTEALSLPVYLLKCGLNAAKEGIAIIAVHGKGNLAKWRRMFSAYEIPCYFIFDNDTADDVDCSKRRDALLSIGIGDDSNGYIASDDWIIEREFAVFGSNFEEIMRVNFHSYAEHESSAISAGIKNKPFVARFVAERMVPDASEGWAKLTQIAAALRDKLGTEAA